MNANDEIAECIRVHQIFLMDAQRAENDGREADRNAYLNRAAKAAKDVNKAVMAALLEISDEINWSIQEFYVMGDVEQAKAMADRFNRYAEIASLKVGE